MKLYMYSKKKDIEAYADFDEESGSFTVLKGSTVSEDVVTTGTFRGANSIIKAREGFVVGRTVTQDAVFTSASTAANFVTGRSTNGLIAWKTKDGKTLKEYLK